MTHKCKIVIVFTLLRQLFLSLLQNDSFIHRSLLMCSQRRVCHDIVKVMCAVSLSSCQYEVA